MLIKRDAMKFVPKSAYDEARELWKKRWTDRASPGILHISPMSIFTCSACVLTSKMNGKTTCRICPIDYSYITEPEKITLDDGCFCCDKNSRFTRWVRQHKLSDTSSSVKCDLEMALAKDILELTKWYDYDDWINLVVKYYKDLFQEKFSILCR